MQYRGAGQRSLLRPRQFALGWLHHFYLSIYYYCYYYYYYYYYYYLISLLRQVMFDLTHFPGPITIGIAKRNPAYKSARCNYYYCCYYYYYYYCALIFRLHRQAQPRPQVRALQFVVVFVYCDYDCCDDF